MTAKEKSYEIYGCVTFAETNKPAPGLRVVAMDAGLEPDDKLGETTTNDNGKYRIKYDDSDFSDLGERAPDIYLQLFAEDGKNLASTQCQITYDTGIIFERDIQIPERIEVPTIRTQFTKLLLGNPNYFGTMPDFDLQPVKPMSGNTSYEEITCLGLHPDAERLEAVVNIKRSSGYGSDPCGNGSKEYVRFFVKHTHGWHDLGITDFTAYNLDDTNYAVSISLEEARRWCKFEKLVEVRAILSWQQEPPAGNANWTSPWGNSIDSTVQIAPFDLPSVAVADLAKEGLIQIDPSLISKLDLSEPLPVKVAQPISVVQLQDKYKEMKVPAHRYGFKAVSKLLQSPVSGTALQSGLTSGQFNLAGTVGFQPGENLAEILDALIATDGDTSYEELNCVGYNPETRMLNGVLSIKKKAGYSGDLCDGGSIEYVGYWIWHRGGWQHLGTTQVQVHDLVNIAADDTIEYAVFRAANLPEMSCEDLTGLRLRAILSWNTPPTGPGFDPVWGNVVETTIQPPIGDPEDENRLRLMRINRVTFSHINLATGLAYDPALPAALPAGDCGGYSKRPFAGNLYIEGDFVQKFNVFDPNTGDVLPGTHPLRYQVWVHKTGSPHPGTQLTNNFNIAVFPQNAALPVVKEQTVQSVGGSDYYTYMESNTQAVNPRTLAVWQARGLDEGRYFIHLRGFAWNGTNYVQISAQTQIVYLFNGHPHSELKVDGDTINVRRPQVHLQITSSGGDCGDFAVGDVIEGTYSVTDNFFGKLHARLIPIKVGGVPQPLNPITIRDSGIVQPNPVSFEVTPQADTNGMAGTWSLKTTGMTACGYTILLWSRDRALGSNRCSGHYNETGVGFCLRKKPATSK